MPTVLQEDLANWAGCLQDQREEFSAKNYSQQQVGHQPRHVATD